jgi:hypothetical protein
MRGRDPQHDQRQWNGAPPALVIIALVVAAFPIFGALAFVTRSMGPASIPIWFAAIGGTAYVLRGAVGHAIARVIGGVAPEPPAELPDEVYGELDDLRARVAELEERVDFSERLLVKGQEERGHAP